VYYRLCFHKGGGPDEGDSNRLMSRIIRWWTHGKYTHVELQRDGAQCFSASGYENVVRWKQIRFSHPERWDFVNLDLTMLEDIMILKRIDRILGSKYDYLGAVTCPWRGAHVDHRWYCSEACAWALGIRPSNISPTNLWRYMKVHDGKGTV